MLTDLSTYKPDKHHRLPKDKQIQCEYETNSQWFTFLAFRKNPFSSMSLKNKPISYLQCYVRSALEHEKLLISQKGRQISRRLSQNFNYDLTMTNLKHF